MLITRAGHREVGKAEGGGKGCTQLLISKVRKHGEGGFGQERRRVAQGMPASR